MSYPNTIYRFHLNTIRQSFSLHIQTTALFPKTTAATVPAWLTQTLEKQYAGRAVTGTIHQLVHELVPTFLMLLWSTPGCQVLNTASSERLNGTFRSCLVALGRRTRRSARCAAAIVHGMYWIGTRYNFCTVHTSLRTADRGPQTPAMAAGITDHVWTVDELLHYQVPPHGGNPHGAVVGDPRPFRP